MEDRGQDIVILEPHGDDALISCWEVLLGRAHERDRIEIVTLGESRSSEGLRAHIPRVRACHYAGLPQIPFRSHAVRPSSYRNWKAGQAAVGIRSAWAWSLAITRRKCGARYERSRALCWNYLRTFLDACTREKRRPWIFSPIGIMHPYHILVAEVAAGLRPRYPKFRFFYYSEAPYNALPFAEEIEVTHRAAGGAKARIETPAYEPCLRTKENILREVYPSETLLFDQARSQVILNGERIYLGRSVRRRQRDKIGT